MTDIVANVHTVFQGIRDAALQVGRDPKSVQLIAVTKYVEAERVQQAISAGVTICGENRLQEGLAKIEVMGDPSPVTWHFIGRLQRRKLKVIIGRFALIQSVESIEQIKEIHRWAEERGLVQSILLQVNVGNESTKGGFAASDLLKALPDMTRFPSVHVQGLMAIPPWAEEPESMRPYFRKLKDLSDEVTALGLPGIAMKELSMGMSNDYPIAIQEGATMVRVGSAIFGPRSG